VNPSQPEEQPELHDIMTVPPGFSIGSGNSILYTSQYLAGTKDVVAGTVR
jgi:hypothetical protein